MTGTIPASAGATGREIEFPANNSYSPAQTSWQAYLGAEGGCLGLGPTRLSTFDIPQSGAGALPARGTAGWAGRYLRNAVILDATVALAIGLVTLRERYDIHGHVSAGYAASTLSSPVIWVAALALAGAYDTRLFGGGADEYRRVINAGLGLTSAIAILAYLTRVAVPRADVFLAVPGVMVIDLIARYGLRKRLHWQRNAGACVQRAVAVGYPRDVADLVDVLRREKYHGLTVVAACLTSPVAVEQTDVAGVPVLGGLSDVATAVHETEADTVAILSCPEVNSAQLRRLAWALEKTSTDLCLAPALLDVAGPRTSVRAVAGLPLLYMDHPDLSGLRQVVKGAFDRVASALALILLMPLLLVIAAVIRLADGGPSFSGEIRIGRDSRPFRLYRFRTTARASRQPVSSLDGPGNGGLLVTGGEPQVTRTGARLRRWSLDRLPQLVNVLCGQMSLVGPRPALPDEAVLYGEYVRRRLAVRPGVTGLLQLRGKNTLSWDERVRLDLRYVENWSLALDLLILWKTMPAVIRGRGAY